MHRGHCCRSWDLWWSYLPLSKQAWPEGLVGRSSPHRLQMLTLSAMRTRWPRSRCLMRACTRPVQEVEPYLCGQTPPCCEAVAARGRTPGALRPHGKGHAAEAQPRAPPAIRTHVIGGDEAGS
ncbi:hypothetical protein HPB50_010136 [Hyalomma asiaticum]|uniref:Uncharacterized protein n=1 Tax=Hyalomma asiaticum TaxID=266040 RepID=A0ACB7TBK1_HYAAI|nr:hypothetical protein HPB50_010136 [Hyalomma asiaticum]